MEGLSPALPEGATTVQSINFREGTDTGTIMPSTKPYHHASVPREARREMGSLSKRVPPPTLPSVRTWAGRYTVSSVNEPNLF